MRQSLMGLSGIKRMLALASTKLQVKSETSRSWEAVELQRGQTKGFAHWVQLWERLGKRSSQGAKRVVLPGKRRSKSRGFSLTLKLTC